MAEWNEGYTTDLVYDAGFFRDLTPGHMRLALLLQGVDLPCRDSGEPLRYLELGYGQGVSLNVHAAAVPEEFWGTDFNPDHTVRADETARAAGLETRLLNLSFADLAAKAAELPQFDIIAAHGVWSWISDDSRRRILDILASNLRMGGVFYVSYNTMPGWAPFMPVRDLMAMHAAKLGAAGQPSAEQMRAAYAFARALDAAGAGYFRANPLAVERLKRLEGKSLAYVTHEYLNRNWRPLYFAEVAEALAAVKCAFVTSTRLLNQLEICLPPETAPLLARAGGVEFRETLRDYCQNQTFRADLFVKGTRRLTPRERMDRLGETRLALACQAAAVKLSAVGPMGAMTMKEEIYRPLVDALAEDGYASKTVNRLEDHPSLEKLESRVLEEAVAVLAGAGYVHPAQPADAAARAADACRRMNLALCRRARMGDDVPVLASPVLGGAVPSSRLEQLFLLARQDTDDPGDWAEAAWNALAGKGEKIVRDGKVLDHAEGMAEAMAAAAGFARERLPYLEAVRALP